MNEDQHLSPVEVELFTQPHRLERKLKQLHKGAVLTKGEFVTDIPGYVNDMEWNFFDELHRYYVHNTYHDMLKVFSGKSFSVNIVKPGNLPVFIQVANAKVAPNLFYQTMSILGVFYIHQIMELEQLDRQVRLTRRWYTVSHWLFRPLHGFLNRSLMKLQVKQEEEDNDIIRHRRLQLRDDGFRFTTDKADFTNSNQLTHNVIFPESDLESRVSIVHVTDDKVESLKAGILELMAKKEAGGLRVWPGICPHEGAAMTGEHICNGVAECPWHGLKFDGVLLEEGGAPWSFMAFDVSLGAGELVVKRAGNVSTQPAAA